MAGNLTNYLENKILDHVLNINPYTAPSTLYLALYTVAPTDSTSGTEVVGGSYVRQVVTFGAANAGVCSNNSNIDYPGMPSCTVVAVGILDAFSAGNLMMYGPLVSSKVVDQGDTFRIATGDLDVSID